MYVRQVGVALYRFYAHRLGLGIVGVVAVVENAEQRAAQPVYVHAHAPVAGHCVQHIVPHVCFGLGI